MKYWFISDTHFDMPLKMIQTLGRKFDCTEAMNNRIIRNWNQRIKDVDTVFMVGDFFHAARASDKKRVSELQNKLHGHIIYVQGNHDSNNGVKTVIMDMHLRLGGKNILVQHYPVESFKAINHSVDLIVHGHTHKTPIRHLPQLTYVGGIPQVNVNVEYNNYMPIDIQQILKIESRERKNHLIDIKNL